MKKINPSDKTAAAKKGYNEKNPTQSQGAFKPAADQTAKETTTKSNTADKKAKEDRP
jgi:hypothetical protein